ncbi:MAG: acetyl-CoA synthase subunit gamma [Clostridiales bacterium]|nr:acetyl-CoA synthase subunit gamma [Clostridiales bacterium]
MPSTCCGGSTPVKRRTKQTSCCGNESTQSKQSSCCSQEQTANRTDYAAPETAAFEQPWVVGKIATPAGEVPQVAAKLSFRDTIGAWKCRWSIGRMNYRVDPGLYAVGQPDASSPVLVTSNYKMTFDRLRERLGGLSLWIVVLDTDGVNVWCAAGKGTFGTDELVRRVSAVRLSEVVSHRTLILPQLGAVGVYAHEVTKQTKFRVVYGPVRAKDVPAFLANGMQTTEEMRTVRFTFRDRIVLTPMELVGALTPVLIMFGILFILNAVGFGHYGSTDFFGIMGSIFTGAVLTPILLPWVPGRAFSLKGAILGLVWAVGFLLLSGFPSPVFGWLKAAAYVLLLPALSSFLTMNFTGSSTYTSLSGVDREMKFAVPAQLAAAVSAILLLLVSDAILTFGGKLI